MGVGSAKKWGLQLCAQETQAAGKPPPLARSPRRACSGPSFSPDDPPQGFKPVDVPTYDFARHQRSSETRRVPPADVVIIEGILVMHMAEVRELCNMKIFVDSDDDVRLARR